jgi:hypothetical protein
MTRERKEVSAVRVFLARARREGVVAAGSKGAEAEGGEAREIKKVKIVIIKKEMVKRVIRKVGRARGKKRKRTCSKAIGTKREG